MIHENVPSCCTASFIHRFGHESKAALKQEIKDACDYALRCRKALVHAYTIATQNVANQALEESGFVKVMDVEDYKYPTQSRRLYLWAYDLNIMRRAANNAPPAITAPVNPFAQPAPLQPAPTAPRAQAPIRLRQQNGRFMPAIGVEFTLYTDRPIPDTWNGIRFEVLSPVTGRWNAHGGQLRGYVWARVFGNERRIRRIS